MINILMKYDFIVILYLCIHIIICTHSEDAPFKHTMKEKK
jgi:hypothetical protein